MMIPGVVLVRHPPPVVSHPIFVYPTGHAYVVTSLDEYPGIEYALHNGALPPLVLHLPDWQASTQ